MIKVSIQIKTELYNIPVLTYIQRKFKGKYSIGNARKNASNVSICLDCSLCIVKENRDKSKNTFLCF